jgi:hypothetical protein
MGGQSLFQASFTHTKDGPLDGKLFYPRFVVAVAQRRCLRRTGHRLHVANLLAFVEWRGEVEKRLRALEQSVGKPQT